MERVTELLAQITSRTFCAGLVLHDDVVVLAAPYLANRSTFDARRDREVAGLDQGGVRAAGVDGAGGQPGP